jgi:hypothetical protein
MRKLSVVLCFVTLIAVILDVALFHSGMAHAQQSGSRVRVERVMFGGGTSGTASVDGKVVGFTCIDVGGVPACFVASGWITNAEK